MPLWAVGPHGRGGTLSPILTPNLTCPPKTGPHFRLAWWAGGGPEDEQVALCAGADYGIVAEGGVLWPRGHRLLRFRIRVLQAA